MIYIVDIDDTICYLPEGTRDYRDSIPHFDRIDKINQLYKDGHVIIYWTARGGHTGIDWTDVTKNSLDKWGCLYHEIRMRKPNYDVWIDDKAINALEYFK